MLLVCKAHLDGATEALDCLLKGHAPPEIVLPRDSPKDELEQMMRYLNALIRAESASTQFAGALARGDLSFQAPKHGTPLTHSLKNLQASLRHLTWKTEEIAKGDFTQRVDFMGEFSAAFNSMVEQLAASRKLLQESEERYALAVRGANDGIWDWNPLSDHLYLSPRWKAMLGYPDDEIGSDMRAWVNLVHEDDREQLKAALSAHCRHESSVFECEYRAYHKTGGVRWLLSRGQAVYDAEGRATRLAGSQTDITESKAFDPLTRLANRLLLRDRIKGAIALGKRKGSYDYALLFLDLDGFKVINDSLGHLAGDDLLVQIAARLKQQVRAAESHRVFSNCTLARLGGDEFAALLQGISSERTAVSMAERLLECLKEPFLIARQLVFASVSIGIACGCAEADSVEAILADADTAMYAAKSQGRARYHIFHPSLRTAAIERLRLETELRRAAGQGELMLVYQPIVRLTDSEVIEFEALVRWNHPVRGILGPELFIPLAEETGIIEDIGTWVLREACRQVVEWNRRRPQHIIAVGVNVSAKQLRQERFVEIVGGIMAETGVQPGYLNIEVTESCVMENPELAGAVLQQLRCMGIRIHMDDFGTGYSSLQCLRRLPFDTIKIDRSFVTNVNDTDEGSEFIRAIVSLGESLGMQIIAEGVEQADQVETVAKLGCAYGQGYYFAKPMDTVNAEELMIRPAPVPEQKMIVSLRNLHVAVGPGLMEMPVPESSDLSGFVSPSRVAEPNV